MAQVVVCCMPNDECIIVVRRLEAPNCFYIN